MAETGLNDPQFVAKLRRDMVRFAELQLRDRASAEDATQEALAAAFQQVDRFESRSSLRTWVLSILKNKIIDILRLRARQVDISSPDDDEADVNSWFDDAGHWTEDTQPAQWGNPEQSLTNSRFWTIFEACLDRLPEAPARVFMMREVVGLDTDEICKTLSITSNNCWVLLHRARLALRACLGEGWFPGGAH